MSETANAPAAPSRQFGVFPRDPADPAKGFGVYEESTDMWTDDVAYSNEDAMREMWRLNGAHPDAIAAAPVHPVKLVE